MLEEQDEDDKLTIEERRGVHCMAITEDLLKLTTKVIFSSLALLFFILRFPLFFLPVKYYSPLTGFKKPWNS